MRFPIRFPRCVPRLLVIPFQEHFPLTLAQPQLQLQDGDPPCSSRNYNAPPLIATRTLRLLGEALSRITISTCTSVVVIGAAEVVTVRY